MTDLEIDEEVRMVMATRPDMPNLHDIDFLRFEKPTIRTMKRLRRSLLTLCFCLCNTCNRALFDYPQDS
jgi:hypothetical protein